MAYEVIMPKQGLQMTEGTITSWLIKEGEKVVKNEPLFEMETDKLTITMDAPESGTLLKIVHGEGTEVPITELIAVIGEEGENISDILSKSETITGETKEESSKKVVVSQKTESSVVEEKETKAQTIEQVRPQDGRILITPRAKMRAEENKVDYSNILGTGKDGLIVERDILNYFETRPQATPLAQNLAMLNNVSLEEVDGSGSKGKITKADILAEINKQKAGSENRGETLIPFTKMRSIIAERMKLSQDVMALATHQISVDMSEATNLRNTYKKFDKRVSFNDIVSLATVRTLKDYPMLNSVYTDDGIIVKDYVNLGVAVAIDTGLIVPVIRDADLMTIEQIGVMTRELAENAKNGTLAPDDYQGGTFTITNLGMYGLDSFVPINNSPETGILAVGAIKKTPIVDDNDEIVVRPIMTITLSYDHRVVDGAPAAEFITRVKEYLENPYLLL